MLESGNYFSDTSFVGHRFDPRDGLVFKPNSNFSVRASFGTAFVAPYYALVDTSETANVANNVLTLPPDSGFKPETAASWDVGTDIKFSPDTLLEVDGFVNNIFNRFTETTLQERGSLNGKDYTSVTQLQNEANVKEEAFNSPTLMHPSTASGSATRRTSCATMRTTNCRRRKLRWRRSQRHPRTTSNRRTIRT